MTTLPTTRDDQPVSIGQRLSDDLDLGDFMERFAGGEQPNPDVAEYLLAPLYAKYKRAGLTDAEMALNDSMDSVTFAKYSKDTLVATAREWIRNNKFWPFTCELVEIAERHHANDPKVVHQRKLDAVRSHLDRNPDDGGAVLREWSTYQHGPRLGESGCLVSADDQCAMWRRWLSKLREEAPQLLAYRVLQRLRVDVSSSPCPIPSNVLREFDLLVTREDIEAQRAEHQRLEQETKREQEERRALAEAKWQEKQRREKQDEQARRNRCSCAYTLRQRELMWLATMGRNFRSDVPATPLPEANHWSWPDTYGPLPGEPGCFVPPEHQRKFGFEPDATTIEYWNMRRQHEQRDPKRQDMNWFAGEDVEPDCREILDRATQIVDGVRVLKPMALRPAA